MAIFGWLVLVALTLFLTAKVIFISFDTLGKYNIGGIPNTLKNKIFTFITIISTAIAWYFLFKMVLAN